VVLPRVSLNHHGGKRRFRSVRACDRDYHSSALAVPLDVKESKNDHTPIYGKDGEDGAGENRS